MDSDSQGEQLGDVFNLDVGKTLMTLFLDVNKNIVGFSMEGAMNNSFLEMKYSGFLDSACFFKLYRNKI
jgi:hypothetical protein